MLKVLLKSKVNFKQKLRIILQGLFSIYQAWQSIVYIVAVIAADRCITIDLMKFSGDRRGYISSLQGMMTITILVSFLWVLAFGKISIKFFELPIYIIAMMFIVSLMDNSFANWSWYERYEYHYRRLAIVNVIFAFVTHTGAAANIIMNLIFIPNIYSIIRLRCSSVYHTCMFHALCSHTLYIHENYMQ